MIGPGNKTQRKINDAVVGLASNLINEYALVASDLNARSLPYERMCKKWAKACKKGFNVIGSDGVPGFIPSKEMFRLVVESWLTGHVSTFRNTGYAALNGKPTGVTSSDMAKGIAARTAIFIDSDPIILCTESLSCFE